MKRIIFILFFQVFFDLQAQGNLAISIIIPCCPKHVKHLYTLLKWYEKQTKLPDEIIVSISEINRINDAVLEKLSNASWIFPVRIFTSDKKQWAGDNRNIACQHAEGDIFICQDADDVPHPQRVEIINYFFKNYPIDHLMHRYTLLKNNYFNSFIGKKIRISDITFMYPTHINHVLGYRFVTNGNVAISREAFNQVQWTSKPNGQDVEFNMNIFKNKIKSIIISPSLLGYRNFLSSNRRKDEMIDWANNIYLNKQ